MIRTSSEDSMGDEEFFQLRTLQYLSVSLEQNPGALKAYLSNAAIPTGKVGRMGIRSQVQTFPNEPAGPQVQEQLFEILLARTLYHDSHRIRTWALNCLAIIAKTDGVENTMDSFMKDILNSRDEILADKE